MKKDFNMIVLNAVSIGTRCFYHNIVVLWGKTSDANTRGVKDDRVEVFLHMRREFLMVLLWNTCRDATAGRYMGYIAVGENSTAKNTT